MHHTNSFEWRETHWLRRFGLAVAFTAGLLHAPALAQDGPDEEESTFIGGSYYVEGPDFLEPGPLQFSISTNPETTFTFEADAEALDEYPGSLICDETPFGPAVLLRTDGSSDGEYLLGFLDTGVTVPVAWSEIEGGFVGSNGAYTFEVGWAPVAQDPQPPAKIGPGGKTTAGAERVRITGSPNSRFVQFFNKTVTWKGVTVPGGVNVSGGYGGTATGTGNNGAPHVLDGSRTYVDSRLATGHYGRGGVASVGSMTDAPNIVQPDVLEGLIENANPGVNVTEVTTVWHFTTYVYTTPPGGVETLVAKIEWSHVETVKVPNGGPHPANGAFGGPGIGPGQPPFTAGGIPVVTPTGAMAAHHNAALTNYTASFQPGGAAPTGAPNGNNW